MGHDVCTVVPSTEIFMSVVAALHVADAQDVAAELETFFGDLAARRGFLM